MKKIFTESPATLGLILANVLVFIIFFIKVGTLEDPAYSLYLLDTGALFNPFTLNGQWYRIFTSMFLHGVVQPGYVLHLLLNMYALFSVGTALEMDLGSRKLLGIYFACGISAALASLYFSLFAISVGASGAIFGLFGYQVVMDVVGSLNSGRRILPMLLNFVFFILVYLFIAASFHVDHAGHLGGFLTGVIFSVLDQFVLHSRMSTRAVIVAFPLLFLLYFALPRDQVHYYNFFKQVIDAEDESREMSAKTGISNAAFAELLEQNKSIWDSAQSSLAALKYVRPELREDTFNLRRYISLRAVASAYRLRIVHDEKYILMDSIEHVDDSMKSLVQLRYVIPIRRAGTATPPPTPSDEEPPKMVKVWYDSNWIEQSEPSVYYRLGFKDSLDQWDGPVRDHYADGKIQMKGVYAKDQRDGIFIYYSHHDTYTGAGRFVENRRVGKWQTFHSNGALESEVFYNQGYFLSNRWDSAGRAQVVNGRGTVIEYYPSGRIKEEGQVFEGRRSGTWTGYFEDGSIHYKEEYTAGQLVRGRARNRTGDTFIYDQSVYEPLPETGAEAFKNYVNHEAQKLGRPEIGTITVLFRVTAEGRLTDFEFEKEVSPEVKGIVKQILFDGPAWRPARQYGYENTDGYANVKVEF